MKNKTKIFAVALSVGILILAGIVLAAYGSLFQQSIIEIDGSQYKNVSGTVELNISIVANGTQNNHIVNVTFIWMNSSSVFVYNGSAVSLHGIYNTTVFNTSANQTYFTNTSFDTTLLADGNYTLTALYFNVSGSFNTTNLTNSLVNFYVDNTGPLVTNANITGGNSTTLPLFNINSNNQTLSVNVSDVMTDVSAVIFRLDNYSGIGVNATGANTSGIWTASFNVSSLYSGTHVVTVFVNDSSNSVNVSQTFTFYVNNPQNVTWMDLKNRNYSSGTQTFNVSVMNGTIFNSTLHNVIFMFDNASGNDFNITNKTGGFSGAWWNITIDVARLTEGNHTVKIFANDSWGNQNATETLQFFYDPLYLRFCYPEVLLFYLFSKFFKIRFSFC